MALPFLCRVIGAVFIPVGLWLLFRSRRPLRWCLAGVAAASLPWVLWSLRERASGTGILFMAITRTAWGVGRAQESDVGPCFVLEYPVVAHGSRNSAWKGWRQQRSRT